MNRVLILLPMPLLLGANCCYGRPPLGRLPDTPCHKQKVDGLVGEQRTPRIEERARERSRNDDIRWIAPGDAVTEDYRETRLNIHVDDKGIIQSATCG